MTIANTLGDGPGLLRPVAWRWSGFGPCALLLLFALLAGPAVAASIEVAPERNPVAMNESFNLVFSAEQKPDDDPDFSPLEKDFTILNQGQSSQFSIVNGSFSRKTEWTLALMPKRAGNLTIPAIAFGSDRSEPVSLTVLAAPQEPAGGLSELMLEVQAEPKNPYVQAQVHFTVRVLRRVNFSGADLSEPVAHDALIERLGEDRSYRAERGGQQYAVIERQYAVFPQKSGVLRIDPVTLEATIPTAGRSRFNSFFGQGSRVARVQSQAVELTVRPIPSSFTGKHWLPAESLELSESWSSSPPQAAVGEPITRTLELRAKGATVGVLPELDTGLAPAGGDQVKRYPDQPVLNEEKRANGVISSRQEKIALLPGRPGAVMLPAIEIPWWNTATDRQEVARLPERTLTVTGTAEQAPASTPGIPQAPIPDAGSLAAAADQSEPGALPSANPRSGVFSNPWFWGCLVAFLGWLVTAIAWTMSRRVVVPPAQPQGEAPIQQRAASKALKSACAADAAERARDALLLWGKARWPQQAPTNLADIAERVGGELSAEVRALEQALYGRSPHAWRGARLWERVAALETEVVGAKAGLSDLEPLYRN